MIVIQMAKLSGFSPIITTASPHNFPLLKALGADHVLDRNTPHTALLSQIATLVADVPLTFAYDAISSPETQHVAYNALAPGGTMIITWEKTITTAEEQTCEGKNIAEVFASVYVPQNREIGVALFKQLPGWLESKVLQVRFLVDSPSCFHFTVRFLAQQGRSCPRWPGRDHWRIAASQDWCQRDQVGRPSSRNF